MKKVCCKCKQEKPIILFPKHKRCTDGIDPRCKDCIKKHSAEVRAIHKNAPPKPDRCDCCKTPAKRLYLDHEHGTTNFRGWLCHACNHGIACLGDNIDGLSKAIEYLNVQQKEQG